MDRVALKRAARRSAPPASIHPRGGARPARYGWPRVVGDAAASRSPTRPAGCDAPSALGRKRDAVRTQWHRSYVLGHGDRSYDVVHYDLDLTYSAGALAISRPVSSPAVPPRTSAGSLTDLPGLHAEKVPGRGPAAKYTHKGQHADGPPAVDARHQRGGPGGVRVVGQPGCRSARATSARQAGNQLDDDGSQ